jgi:uncharacterized protein YqgV (UPF0045/DUF77 family)
VPQGAEDRVLAEVSIEPAVEGAAHGRLVRQAIEALDGPELTLRIGPLGTTLEGELDDVLHAVARAHRSVASSAERVITHVRLEGKSTGIDLSGRDAETIDRSSSESDRGKETSIGDGLGGPRRGNEPTSSETLMSEWMEE